VHLHDRRAAALLLGGRGRVARPRVLGPTSHPSRHPSANQASGGYHGDDQSASRMACCKEHDADHCQGDSGDEEEQRKRLDAKGAYWSRASAHPNGDAIGASRPVALEFPDSTQGLTELPEDLECLVAVQSWRARCQHRDRPASRQTPRRWAPTTMTSRSSLMRGPSVLGRLTTDAVVRWVELPSISFRPAMKDHAL
jgi:hypothetical protein